MDWCRDGRRIHASEWLGGISWSDRLRQIAGDEGLGRFYRGNRSRGGKGLGRMERRCDHRRIHLIERLRRIRGSDGLRWIPSDERLGRFDRGNRSRGDKRLRRTERPRDGRGIHVSERLRRICRSDGFGRIAGNEGPRRFHGSDRRPTGKARRDRPGRTNTWRLGRKQFRTRKRRTLHWRLERHELWRNRICNGTRHTRRPHQPLSWIEARRRRLGMRKRSLQRLHRFRRSEDRSLGHLERKLLFAAKRLGNFPASIITSDISERSIRRERIWKILRRKFRSADVWPEGEIVQSFFLRERIVFLGVELGAIVRSQDLGALQIFIGVNVLWFFVLGFLARSFLASSVGDILRRTPRCSQRHARENKKAAESQTKKSRGTPRRKREADRRSVSEISSLHVKPTTGGHRFK